MRIALYIMIEENIKNQKGERAYKYLWIYNITYITL